MEYEIAVILQVITRNNLIFITLANGSNWFIKKRFRFEVHRNLIDAPI
jgi:hypothetical protein